MHTTLDQHFTLVVNIILNLVVVMSTTAPSPGGQYDNHECLTTWPHDYLYACKDPIWADWLCGEGVLRIHGDKWTQYHN